MADDGRFLPTRDPGPFVEGRGLPFGVPYAFYVGLPDSDDIDPVEESFGNLHPSPDPFGEREEGSTILKREFWTDVLDVPVDSVIADTWPDAPGNYVQDVETEYWYKVIFVERQRFAPDFIRAYLARTASPESIAATPACLDPLCPGDYPTEFPILYKLKPGSGASFQTLPGSMAAWERCNAELYLCADVFDEGFISSPEFQDLQWATATDGGLLRDLLYGGTRWWRYTVRGPRVTMRRKGFDNREMPSYSGPAPSGYDLDHLWLEIGTAGLAIVSDGSGRMTYRTDGDLCSGAVTLDWFSTEGSANFSVVSRPDSMRLESVRTARCLIPDAVICTSGAPARRIFFGNIVLACGGYFPLGCSVVNVIFFPSAPCVWEGFYANLGAGGGEDIGQVDVCYGELAARLEFLGGTRWRCTLWFNIDSYLSWLVTGSDVGKLSVFEGDVSPAQIENFGISGVKRLPLVQHYPPVGCSIGTEEQIDGDLFGLWHAFRFL